METKRVVRLYCLSMNVIKETTRFKGAWAELMCQASKTQALVVTLISGDNFRIVPPNCMVS